MIGKLTIGLCTLAIAFMSWFPTLNKKADEAAQAGLTRTMTAFAVVRAASSAVAILSSTNIGVAKVGEALHPVGNVIDHVLDILLIASASFALQIMLLKIGAHWAVSALLTGVLAYVVVKKFSKISHVPAFSKACLVLLLLVRFSVPVAALATQGIYDFVIKDSEDAVMVGFRDAVSGDLNDKSVVVVEPTRTIKIPFFSKIKDKAGQALQYVRTSIEPLSELVASYILQSIFMPLCFLALFWIFAKQACEEILRCAIGSGGVSSRVSKEIEFRKG